MSGAARHTTSRPWQAHAHPGGPPTRALIRRTSAAPPSHTLASHLQRTTPSTTPHPNTTRPVGRG